MRDAVSTDDLRKLDVPFVKVQVTTRGSAGSSEVIMRGVRNLALLAAEAPGFYGAFLSVEVVTESQEQVELLLERFADCSIPVSGLLLPPDYATRRALS